MKGLTLSGFLVQDYIDVGYVPTATEARAKLILSRRQVAKTELTVGSSSASSYPLLLRMVPLKGRRLVQQILRVVEDFDEGMLQRSAVIHFNCPLQVPIALLLDENDYLIATPVSGFFFVRTMTFAIAKNGWGDEHAGEQGCSKHPQSLNLGNPARLGRNVLRPYRLAPQVHGWVMSSGLTRASNSSPERKPSFTAASRRLECSLWAVLATLAALS